MSLFFVLFSKKNLKNMSNIQKVSDAIVKQGILPLYFNADENVTIEILRSIYKAGIRAVEYTNRGEAVSYTHLDVYKRQKWYSGNDFFKMDANFS